MTCLTSTSTGVAEGSNANGDGAAEKSTRGKLGKVWNRVAADARTAPFALAIAAGFLGYKLGTRNGAMAATKAAAGATATKSTRSFPLLTLVLFAVAIRDTWSLIPNWAKKNIPFVGKRVAIDDGKADPDDMTSFATISTKLRSLFKRGKERMGSDDDVQNPILVFFALIRLLDQVKDRLAGRRDELYQKSGRNVENLRDVLDGIDIAFEHADWAYNEFEEGDSLKKRLAGEGYSLLRHEPTALPGHVAHYIAVSPERKEALIAVKGTSNFEDMLTDCCGDVVKFKLDAPFVEGGRDEIYCHEGILVSARRLAEDLLIFVRDVLLPSGYKLRVTGHSLGAGCAVLFAVILRSKIEELKQDNGQKLKVLAFASPPILDYEASKNCESFVTTYINNSDIVTRASLSNLINLIEFMRVVNKHLSYKDMSPKDLKSTVQLLKKMAMDDKDAEMIMTEEEIQKAIHDSFAKVDVKDHDHVYVGGRVIHMYDQWAKKDYGNKSYYDDDGDNSDEIKKVPTAEKIYEGNGTADVLRLIEIDDRMMTDHLSPGYRATIRSLLDKADRQTPTRNIDEKLPEETTAKE